MTKTCHPAPNVHNSPPLRGLPPLPQAPLSVPKGAVSEYPSTSDLGTGQSSQLRKSATVVLAAFRPDPAQLEAQLASIAGQSLRPAQIVAVIADLTSGPLVEEVAARHGLACHLVLPERGLDAPRAFAAGLAAAVEHSAPDSLIALSDQDDIWHPERLARGAALLEDPEIQLIHSDARVVDAEGAELHPSVFALERRMRAPSLRDLLYRNTVTGMTTLFRRELAELSLPFPGQSGVHFYHDLWLALLATATGRVALIEEPLVDYRQHGANAVGAIGGARRLRLWQFRRPALRIWLRQRATSYALARYLARCVQARVSEAVISGRLAPDKPATHDLRPYLRRRGLGLPHLTDSLRLALHFRGELASIAASQFTIAAGRLLWSLREALTEGLLGALSRFDTRLFTLSPGIAPPEIDPAGNVVRLPTPDVQHPQPQPKPHAQPKPSAAFVDTRKTPSWTPKFTAPEPALALLVPTLNPTEAFAGIATAIDIGIGLAARGHRVRMIATDLPMANPAASRAFVEDRAGQAGSQAMQRISLHCGLTGDSNGPDGPVIAQHVGDVYLATAWWTAHVAQTLTRRHPFLNPQFLYLIQDFEPNFYAWGTTCADAAASYTMDYLPVFNTTLLRDHFAHLGLCAPDALAFRPSIEVERYARGTRLPRNGPRRLALYGRPEVERNMFPMAIEALEGFLTAEGLGPNDISLVSVGLRHEPVAFSTGVRLESLGKLPWAEYPDFLLGVDLALSLMYSPHPSHPPLEMAASGVRVVTNRFGVKDLGRLSPAILSAEPAPEALAAALSQAWAAGPVPEHQRQLDLTPLGLPLDAMIDELSAGLFPLLKPEASAA
ncbi:glycosyltransferase [Vannielia litorea]|nr:glycosyltransferase [Vannielia litorea]MBY6076801.1 glycosyltransferase [Vannielia litorea]